MPRVWHEIRWSAKEVDRMKSVAMRKRYEADAALDAALEIELEYWHQVLARKFPKLRDRFHDAWTAFEREYFIGTVAFSDAPAEECVIRLPEKEHYYTTGRHRAVMKVWHRRADGKKFRRDCVEYRCDEIIPFLSNVRVFEIPNNRAATEKQQVEAVMATADSTTADTNKNNTNEN